MASGVSEAKHWTPACTRPIQALEFQQPAPPITPSAGCDLGLGRPQPSLTTPLSHDRVQITVLGLQTAERQRTVCCSVPAVLTDARLLREVAAACGLQIG
eukprot:5817387-Prorocentrum_lima.AAC.1